LFARARGVSAVSAPGQKILFTRYERGSRGKLSDIYVMNADGSGQRKLTERGQALAGRPTARRSLS
jgi:Tol biopolymer transport system component